MRGNKRLPSQQTRSLFFMPFYSDSALIIYSTLGCHLCEQAIAIIQSITEYKIEYEIVDIADSDSLMESYGVRIPVIKNPDSESEIAWPFDREEFIQWYVDDL